MNNKYIYILFYISLYILIFCFSPLYTFSSNYTLDQNNIKIIDTLPNSTIQNNDATLLTSEDSFLKLSVSPDVIQYGALIPGEPILRSQFFKITQPELGSYVLVESQNLLLGVTTKATIADTTCDSGLCNELVADTWKNPLSYGLGYQCLKADKTACLNRDSSPFFYKQFPNKSFGEKPERIIESQIREDSFTLFYKLNLPPNQAKDIYQNKIKYIIVPFF